MQGKLQDFFTGKHLLVLGAGYVGGALLHRLAGTGARLSAVTRNAERAAALRALGVRVHLGDLVSHDWHAAFPQGADHVLFCAAAGGGGEEAYRRCYVEGLRSLINWASAHACTDLSYTSSTAVYPQSGGLAVDESSSCEVSSGHGAILREAETLLLDAPLLARRTVLRLSGIYGPGRHQFLDQARSGAAVSGNPDHHLNLIHRDDVVSAVLALWQSALSGAAVYNVTDNEPVTRAEAAAWVAQRLALPAPVFTGQTLPGRRGSANRRILNTRLRRTLGWEPLYPSFRDGFAALLEADK